MIGLEGPQLMENEGGRERGLALSPFSGALVPPPSLRSPAGQHLVRGKELAQGLTCCSPNPHLSFPHRSFPPALQAQAV